jgi:transcription initiation factor IIE alpha subunit
MKIPKPYITEEITQEVRYEALKETEEYHCRQDEEILRQLYFGKKTASEIEGKTGIRLTSVRRALSNLKKDGLILATGKKLNPDKTAPETIYEINKNYKKPVKFAGMTLQQGNFF